MLLAGTPARCILSSDSPGVTLRKMNKQRRWLFRELDRWTSGAIVTPEQAARIRALYPSEEPGAPWGLIAFSGIGAVVVGLGVILLLAYNWEDIPRLGKLALILGATAATHTGGTILRERPGWPGQFAEVFSVLGTMFFGAGIWLVAQIYHIDEHYPNGYLFWGLGALAMAWALRSVPQGLIAVATLSIWGGSEVVGFARGAEFVFVMLAAGILPLAWHKRSIVLLGAVLAGLYLMLIMHAGHRGGASTGFLAAISLSVLLVGASKCVPSRGDLAPLGGTLRFFGTAAFVICLYILTFENAADDLLARRSPADEIPWQAASYRWTPGIAALAIWVWIARDLLGGRREAARLDEWLMPVILLFSHAFAAAGARHFDLLAVAVFNLAAFLLAALWMVQGCREGRLGRTVVGSLLLAAVVLARFFDLFESLAVRGLIFVVLGAVLLAEGFYYRKLRRASAGEEAPS